jgi:lambda family phage portal protein
MRPFNTTFRPVDLDRLSTPPTETGNPLVKGGIEFDLNGAPRAYHIRKAHPTDWNDPNNWIWKRVEARLPWGRLQVNHVFEQKRVSQSRGISAMVTALKEMRITKRFRDIVLQNAVVNATFAASIESELPTEQVFAQMGGVNADAESYQGAIDSYAKGFLGAIQDYTKGSKNLHLDGVKIPHFFPGTKLMLHKPGEGGPLGTDFEQSLLRYIASSLNVSYEELSRDYSKTNYSSNRAASGVTWRSMQSRKRICADRVATVRYRLWLEEAINKRAIDSVPAALRERGFIYEGQNFDALSACEWIGAGRGQVDELKETQAAGLRLKLGLSTREREIARISGTDWRADIRQMAREERYAAKYGVVLNAEADALNAANGTDRDPGDGQENDKEAA